MIVFIFGAFLNIFSCFLVGANFQASCLINFLMLTWRNYQNPFNFIYLFLMARLVLDGIFLFFPAKNLESDPSFHYETIKIFFTIHGYSMGLFLIQLCFPMHALIISNVIFLALIAYDWLPFFFRALKPKAYFVENFEKNLISITSGNEDYRNNKDNNDLGVVIELAFKGALMFFESHIPKEENKEELIPPL